LELYKSLHTGKQRKPNETQKHVIIYFSYYTISSLAANGISSLQTEQQMLLGSKSY